MLRLDKDKIRILLPMTGFRYAQLTRSHLKIKILAQDQGGAEF
jgi:hypothetical protein